MILDGNKLKGLILEKAKQRGISQRRCVSESEIRKEIKEKLKINRHTLSNWECNNTRLQKNGKLYNSTLQHMYELQWYFDLPNFKKLIRNRE